MNTKKFLVPEGKKLDLKDYPTDFTGDYKGKDEAVEDMLKNIDKMKKLQDVLYAQDIHAILLVFQAMDAAGKDSVIEHVMTGVNPQGCQVTSFKVPSSEEMDHDFLWRTTKALPERGRFGIFNRSYYEEVLVVRVHDGILQGERLPDDVKSDKKVWEKRFDSIRDFEKHLSRNGTVILKFFLHVSKEVQKERFLDRANEPDKNWKFSAGDVKERGFWDDYMNCYTEAMQETSTEHAPWYVIPADKKWFTRAAVAEIICDTLESLDLKYPVLDEKGMAALQEAKKLLESEDQK
jgi:PPK2 family polyphosphate:nucleotide phosphotransferase